MDTKSIFKHIWFNLYTVCCLLCAVCCLLFAVCCLLFAVCYHMYDLIITLLAGCAIWVSPQASLYSFLYLQRRFSILYIIPNMALLPLISYLHTSSFEIFCFFAFTSFTSICYFPLCFRLPFVISGLPSIFNFQVHVWPLETISTVQTSQTNQTPNQTNTIRRKVITNEKSTLD